MSNNKIKNQYENDLPDQHPQPPQPVPGSANTMDRVPDYRKESYRGLGRQQRTVFASAVALATGVATWIAYRQRKKRPAPEVAPYVNINRYLGTWYEIARKPVSFEKNCYGTQAHYSLRDDGKTINVVNTCRKKSLSGPEQVGRAKAWVADPVTNAKLKVQFSWPFRGDYWILAVGKGYDYALVGEPARQDLWLLSRKPTLAPRIMRRLIRHAQAQGYDTDDLIFTTQKV